MRVKSQFIIIVMLFSLTLFGCSKDYGIDDNKQNDNEYFIYYTSDDNTRIHYQKYTVSSDDTIDIINELINELRKGDFKESKKSALPEGTLTININDDILNLDFDENYNKYKGVEEIIRRAAIVKTLCQIPNISFVQFSVNGQGLVLNGNVVGNMDEKSFVDNIGNSSNYSSAIDINVYYSNAYGTKLRKTMVSVEYDGSKSVEMLAVEKVLQDPNKIGYYEIFQPGVKINRLVIDGKRCYIDFNEQFLKRKGGVSEEVVVYSIVNTLTDLSNVNQVFITVDGEEREYYEDSVKMNVFIERNFDINEERE